MKILVRGVAPGSKPETITCTSKADFLVYLATNGVGGYSVNVKSTGFGMGTESPTFTVGGTADDVVTFIFQSGTTGFITLQTEKTAIASIT